MKEYIVYRVYNSGSNVFRMKTFNVLITEKDKKVNLKYPLEKNYEVLEDKEVNLKELRNLGLIPEWLYNVSNVGLDSYFAAIKHKDRYYMNVLWKKEGYLKGNLPSFWTSAKWALYLTLYLLLYILFFYFVAKNILKLF